MLDGQENDKNQVKMINAKVFNALLITCAVVLGVGLLIILFFRIYMIASINDKTTEESIKLLKELSNFNTTEVIALIYSVVVTAILSFGFTLFNNMQETVRKTKESSNEFENQYKQFISGKNAILNSIYFSDIIMDVSQTLGYFTDFDKQSAKLRSRRILNLKSKLIRMESHFDNLSNILEKCEILPYQKRILIESFNNIILSIDTIIESDKDLKEKKPPSELIDQKDINDLEDCKNKCENFIEKIRDIPNSTGKKIPTIHTS